LVVVHDNDLQRVAGVNAQVKDLSFEELSQIDVGSHKDPRFSSERIPTLDQVFSTFGTKVYYDIEMKVGVMKDTGIAAKTLQVIQDHRNSLFQHTFRKIHSHGYHLCPIGRHPQVASAWMGTPYRPFIGDETGVGSNGAGLAKVQPTRVAMDH
jgi:hypothetical protein